MIKCLDSLGAECIAMAIAFDEKENIFFVPTEFIQQFKNISKKLTD